MNNNDNHIVETDIDVGKKLFESRMRMKAVSQLSFEIQKIERSFPADYYDFNSSSDMLGFYQLIEEKILELAEDISKSRNK